MVRNHYHPASTWLRAFRAAGLEVADCREPRYTEAVWSANPTARLYPDAVRAAFEGLPAMWVWTLHRPER